MGIVSTDWLEESCCKDSAKPCTLICRSVVIEKGRQFRACAFIAIQNQWDLTRMREIDDFFCDNRPAIQCTEDCKLVVTCKMQNRNAN